MTTISSIQEQSQDLATRLTGLQERRRALAYDVLTDTRAKAELTAVEGEIATLTQQQQHLTLAGEVQVQRDTEDRRRAEADAREQAKRDKAAYEQRRLEHFAIVTKATAALTVAIRATLSDCPGRDAYLRLGDHVAGEVTAAGLELFGMGAPRRPLPQQEAK